ncbi:MAG: peptide chain release factor N(5)-glutamine methyltransferase [Comamonadaceae bacterium]
MPTLLQALIQAQSCGLDRLDAQLLLLHALDRPAQQRAWLLAHDDEELSATAQSILSACVQRRAGGEPLAYITGHKEFFGLDLWVDARVLIPRPDTETLVEWALEVLPAQTPAMEPARVLDLGTGSGAIALALKVSRPELQVSAMDVSEDALAVARENAKRLRLEIDFRQGSWLSGVQEKYHAIVSNPPYIAEQDRHLEALRHEPAQALSSGADGLHDIRQIVVDASARLHSGGWLLLEHGFDQAETVRQLLFHAGFSSIQSRNDLNGIERCTGGRTAQYK